jgi:peptide deformylase
LLAQGDPVKVFSKDLESLCWAMLNIMDRTGGIGLAAQQVGRKERVCVIDTSCQWDKQTLVEQDGRDLLHQPMDDSLFPLFLVNGKIIVRSEELLELSEGCLSIPGIYARTRRHRVVTVSYQDQWGNPHCISADGLLGHCMQHELDHNNGILFINPERLLAEDLGKVQLLLYEQSQQYVRAKSGRESFS